MTDNDIISIMLTFPNASIAEYSNRLSVSPIELMKRLTALPLKAALAEARAESVADASILAESLAVRAVNTIAHIMDSPHAKDCDRIRASKALIDVGVKLSEVVHTTPQLELMRAKLEEKGFELKERKMYARVHGRPNVVTDTSPLEDEVVSTPIISSSPPVVADDVMTRLQDILRKGRGNE